jgi:hypothetical protein
MPSTTFNIFSDSAVIKDQWGGAIGDNQFAIVQWDYGFDPARHTVNEWASTPLLVDWAGSYTASTHVISGQTTPIDFGAPLYMFVNPAENWSQVGLWQITDILTLPGGTVTIDIGQTNIRDVLGAHSAGVLYTTDYTVWQPQAVPEPSHYGAFMGVALLAGAILARFCRQKAVAGKPDPLNEGLTAKPRRAK